MYRGALLLDGHVDTPLRVAEGIDIGTRQSTTHLDIPRMRAAGLDAVFMAAWVDPALPPPAAHRRACDLLDLIHDLALRHDELAFADSRSTVLDVVASGRIALLAGVENGDALGGRLENLESLAARGARYLTLTWMHANALADAAGDRVHGGLSDLGRVVVDAMGELGMLVDLAHASTETFWEVLDRVDRPVVVSHSATEANGPHPRNVDDEQLRGLARNGGMIGINFFPAYLAPGAESADWTAILDHIERVVDTAGIDHVGLGSDLDGIPALPSGFDGVESLPRVAAGLEQRGYAAPELRKILGGNWLRVLDEVVGRARR